MTDNIENIFEGIRELGAAKMSIELVLGDIVIRHAGMEGHPISLIAKDVEKGEWDRLYEYLASIKCSRFIVPNL